VTYNVRYFGHGTRGVASTSAAIERIAGSLARLSPLPDLMCLQEVETQSLRSSTMNPPGTPEQTQLDQLMLERTAPSRRASLTAIAHYSRRTPTADLAHEHLHHGLAVIARRCPSITTTPRAPRSPTAAR
jgi:endonuclease/exonuclease/phosphatase family metal-dependent hydrolase